MLKNRGFPYNPVLGCVCRSATTMMSYEKSQSNHFSAFGVFKGNYMFHLTSLKLVVGLIVLLIIVFLCSSFRSPFRSVLC